MSLLFYLLLCILSISLLAHALAPRAFLLNCGSSETIEINNQTWFPDEGYATSGNISTIETPDLWPLLAKLRYFPDTTARKYCYVLPVTKGGRYLVRTTYYYGKFDGGKEPPVFDQIIDGMKWSTVNTTEDFNAGLSSYYEIIVAAMGKTMSICLARNQKTTSSPFISAMELNYLDDSMYNSTDFKKYALSTVARHSFGDHGDVISFPDDQYNRFWQPLKDNNPMVVSHYNITPADFWNSPPMRVFQTAVTTSRGKELEIQWPPASLPASKYYIVLYFQDNRTPSPYSWRVLDVSINGEKFYRGLNVTTAGVSVYSTEWPLSGVTKITLSPGLGIPVGPIINAGEILQLVPLGGRTLTRDVIAMEDFARNLENPPSDWKGDPCLPTGNSWTGITCSHGNVARIVTLNLTSAGLTGSLPPSIGNLTSLTNIWLGKNKLSGTIPEMGQLVELESLHLEDNQFEGSIPKSLGQLPKLTQISLQNNKLKGPVPDSLQRKKNSTLQ